jgi:threonine dehydrogenase-like Zn-dependent dehydrogenase
VAVFGLGPVGQFCTRIARAQGAEHVFGVDLVPERLAMAARHGVTPVDLRDGDVVEALRQQTAGRGPDAVIDAVGMESHGSTLAGLMQRATGMLPDRIAAPLAEKAGVDRLSALYSAISSVRRGGTVSISGVYGGAMDPMPMLEMFDKQVQVRMGQANVRRWTDDIIPLLVDDADPLGTADLATHRLPLDAAPGAYAMFQKKQDGCVKVVLKP